jgi:hypothetical protein
MSAPISESPIMAMTVPVTSGGKNLSTIENGLAAVPDRPDGGPVLPVVRSS